MTDDISVTLSIANEEEFHESLDGLEDRVHALREEVQALNAELERTEELAGGQSYARQKQGEHEVALLGEATDLLSQR